MVVGGYKDHDSAIRVLRPHTPFHEQIVCKLLDRLAFERRYGDDRDLRVCLLVQLRADCGELVLGLRVQHASKIVYIALRFEVLDLLRPGDRTAENQNK